MVQAMDVDSSTVQGTGDRCGRYCSRGVCRRREKESDDENTKHTCICVAGACLFVFQCWEPHCLNLGKQVVGDKMAGTLRPSRAL